MGAQFAQQQSRPGVAQTHDGGQGQEKGAHQTPVYLLVQPSLQGTNERLQQIGNLLPLPPPHPIPQHMKRPPPVNGFPTIPFHPKGSLFLPVFLYDFSRLYPPFQNSG